MKYEFNAREGSILGENMARVDTTHLEVEEEQGNSRVNHMKEEEGPLTFKRKRPRSRAHRMHVIIEDNSNN